MTSPNAWLADVHAAGGDSEPPPEPDIPTEYAKKPRRGPPPQAYLVTSPPLSTRTSFTRSKRPRAVLSEVDPPNEERQRKHNAPTPAMSQPSRSPTRRSSRQAEMAGKAGKARTTAEEASVEQSSLDPNAMPRPTRGKAAPPPATLPPNLYAKPMPVFTRSVHEKYVDEDVEDSEDAGIESTRKSTTSKRSRSPTRRMVDLHIATQPVVPKTAESSADVPQDVGKLYMEIQELARRSKGVIPLGIETMVKQRVKGELIDLEHYVAKTPNGKTPEQLMDEFKAMQEIWTETSSCKTQHLHEPSWNELVHSQMLKQAVLGRPGFSYYNITTARVDKELVPGNELGGLLIGKVVDYVVTLGSPLISRSHVLNRLAAAPRKIQPTVNPSDYSPLCYQPIVLSIETKSLKGDTENSEVQLSVWAIAYFNRLRQLVQNPVAITLPLVLITGARWILYFASDLADEIQFIEALDIGTTADIIGCYTILEALRIIFRWAEETFVPWFTEESAPE